MHKLTSLHNIKSHTDNNSIPVGLIHVSQNLSIDGLVSKLGEYLNKEFRIISEAQKEEKETVLCYNGDEYTLDYSAYLYPHFQVIQTLRLLADNYSFFLHQGFLKQDVYVLLVIENNTLNDFVTNESFWFDKTFTRIENGFDGFSTLNAVQQRTSLASKATDNKTVKQKPEKDIDFKLHDLAFTEYNRKHSMNGFPIWGVFALLALFMVIGVFMYSKLMMTRYDVIKWNERLSVFKPTPEKIEATQLESYVGKLVDIPSGKFNMGHEKNKKIDDAYPVHEVSLAGFQMMEAEVTFAQWDACVVDGACTIKPNDEGWGRADRPVINISHNDILEEYLPWIYAKTGRKFTLPTEAQWEYAARGGTTSFYAFGDSVKCGDGNFGRHGYHRGYNTVQFCTNDKSLMKTEAVKRYQPNAYGLYDMHGNVAELVADQYMKNYLNANADGSPEFNLAKGDAKISVGSSMLVPIRGGNFSTSKEALHVAYRANQGANNRFKGLGFRLVLNTPKKENL